MDGKIQLFTIGYTKSTAEGFFSRLRDALVTEVVDIRVSNTSQLAGFAKMPDLAFFLDRVGGIGYRFEPLLAPPLQMMRAYRNKELTWATYRTAYLDLLTERGAAMALNPEHFDGACLLCSESTPDQCHRRLAAEYLQYHWSRQVEICHL
ncbi:hypothetical protein JCM17960_03090 [Magnetospira thiophila]